jgi:hypothetical protein
MYLVFVGILAVRYRMYQGCDELLSVILVTCTWVYILYLSNLPYQYFLMFLCSYIPYVSSVPALFYLYSLCFVRVLYTVIPDPFGAAHSQFPEVVFVSIKCFAMGGGAPKDQNIYAQPHHIYKCNGGGCVNTFLLWFITSTVSNVYR